MAIIEFLDLGNQPIANRFLKNKPDNEFKFRLKMGFDEETKLVSQINTVNSDLMFNDEYPYRCGLSKTMVAHFNDIANIIKKRFCPESILEIGVNDGTFIKNFSSEKSVGIEPCKNFACEVSDFGYKIYQNFWTSELSDKIGKFDVIFSSNCICHIPDLDDCFNGIYNTLSNNGVFIFEDPSLLEVIERISYDQIYDEHIHLFGVTALSNILKKHGLEIFHVEKLTTHGGSNRIYVQKIGANKEIDDSVNKNIFQEIRAGLCNENKYRLFNEKVLEKKEKLVNELNTILDSGETIVGYGATSKMTTVLNFCEIGTEHISFFVDTTKEKCGKLYPGVHIPIFKYNSDWHNNVNYSLLGAWNFSKEIRKKETQFINKGGQFILPH